MGCQIYAGSGEKFLRMFGHTTAVTLRAAGLGGLVAPSMNPAADSLNAIFTRVGEPLDGGRHIFSLRSAISEGLQYRVNRKRGTDSSVRCHL
jgi:hypothetical protein